jgi:hypothetical protein
MGKSPPGKKRVRKKILQRIGQESRAAKGEYYKNGGYSKTHSIYNKASYDKSGR